MGLLDNITPWKGLFENTLGKLVDRIPDKNKKNEMKHELESLLSSQDFDEVMKDKDIEQEFMNLAATQVEGANAVAMANAGSSHWLAANWRPISCLCITLCVVYHYVFGPWLVWVQAVYFPDTPPVPQMQDIEELLYLMGGVLGVFGVGRSFEKWKGVATR